MNDLSTTYLGLKLKNPIIAASSPATGNLEDAVRLQDAGVGAIVMRSIFEEEIRAAADDMYDAIGTSFAPAALDYIHADLPMRLGPEKYVELVHSFKKNLSVPVIASINCTTASQWTVFAKKLENAGADAIELNIYDVPLDPSEDSSIIETRRLELISAVAKEVAVPVAVKLSPYYAALINYARKAQTAGANGLVLFNKFLQPDIDINKLSLVESVHFSSEEELRLPLRWVALTRDGLGCDIALSGGVLSSDGLIKALLAGADSVYICSALFTRKGFAIVGDMLDGLDSWMSAHKFTNIASFRGKLREQNVNDGRGFERAHYLNILGKA